jgi:allophanate hydrolase subunit 1
MTVSEKKIRMISAGDSALVLEFGTGISEQINRRIRLFVEELESEF